ncbi:MAG: hypothetical protein ABL958_10475, partial [Bdellovibrionia bacterium]
MPATDYDFYEFLGVDPSVSDRELKSAIEAVIQNASRTRVNVSPQVEKLYQERKAMAERIQELLSDPERRMVYSQGLMLQKSMDSRNIGEKIVWNPSEDPRHPFMKPPVLMFQRGDIAKTSKMMRMTKDVAKSAVSLGNVGFMMGMAMQMYMKCVVTMDPAICWTIQDVLDDVGGWIGLAGFATSAHATSTILREIPIVNMATPIVQYGGMIVGSQFNHVISKFWAAQGRRDASLNFTEYYATAKSSYDKQGKIFDLQRKMTALYRTPDSPERAKQLADMTATINTLRAEYRQVSEKRDRFKDKFWEKIDDAFFESLKTSPEEKKDLILGGVSMITTAILLHEVEHKVLPHLYRPVLRGMSAAEQGLRGRLHKMSVSAIMADRSLSVPILGPDDLPMFRQNLVRIVQREVRGRLMNPIYLYDSFKQLGSLR